MRILSASAAAWAQVVVQYGAADFAVSVPGSVRGVELRCLPVVATKAAKRLPLPFFHEL